MQPIFVLFLYLSPFYKEHSFNLSGGIFCQNASKPSTLLNFNQSLGKTRWFVGPHDHHHDLREETALGPGEIQLLDNLEVEAQTSPVTYLYLEIWHLYFSTQIKQYQKSGGKYVCITKILLITNILNESDINNVWHITRLLSSVPEE